MGEFLNQHVAGGRRRVTEAARTGRGTETAILDWQRPPALQIGDGEVQEQETREAD